MFACVQQFACVPTLEPGRLGWDPGSGSQLHDDVRITEPSVSRLPPCKWGDGDSGCL